MTLRLSSAIVIALLAGSPANASSLVPWGMPIDENYRQQFAQCDSGDVFENIRLPYDEPSLHPGRKPTHWYECSGNQSEFDRFEHVSVNGYEPGAVLIESKLGRDDDGSAKACGPHRSPDDNCETKLMMWSPPTGACPYPKKIPEQPCVPTDAFSVPYVVIPGAGPRKLGDPREFSSKSKLRYGDYGVLIYGNKVVGVIIADIAPFSKVGEGSRALLRILSSDGVPRPIDKGAITILFPGSRMSPSKLSPSTLRKLVRTTGCNYYAMLVGQEAASSCQ
jgi:hypothetical protein